MVINASTVHVPPDWKQEQKNIHTTILSLAQFGGYNDQNEKRHVSDLPAYDVGLLKEKTKRHGLVRLKY